MFVTKRCDVTILRFRNSGIGRKKKRVTKNCCLPLGVSRLAEPSVLMRGSSLAAHGKSAFFFPIQSDEIARMPRTREHLQCTGPPVSLLDFIDSESVRMLKIGLST